MEKFLEFFAARIVNRRTRAGVRAGRGAHGGRAVHVAAYILTHPGSAPTVKQHLAALRMLGDWLVVSQVLPVNPAAAVRGPKHVVTTGATPVLSPAEARWLLEGDRHGHARRPARPGARLGDALQLRAGERGHRDAAGRTTSGRSARGGSGSTRRAARGTTSRPHQRAAAADLPPSTCCHTFRATGITAYLSNGGTLEHAQQIAGHASPKTTKLYDRTADTITVDEIERIVI